MEAQFELPRQPREEEQLVLVPLGSGSRLRIQAAGERPVLPALPLAMDLLPHGRPNVFGVEERCRVENGDGWIDLHCEPGSSPAGLIVRFDGRYPRGAKAHALVSAVAGAGFTAQLVTAGGDAAGPLPIQRPLLPPARSEDAAQLVVLAPSAGGSLRLSSLTLEPIAAAHGTVVTGAWAWEPMLWRRNGAALIRAAAERGVDRLYITLAIEGDRVLHQAQLIRFIREARARSIAVEAVEGDPHMVLAAGLGRAVARARGIAAFERTAPPDARLAEVQYDIEPYTLPDWGSHPADHEGWAKAVVALSAELGRPVHLVLPFWIASDEGGRRLLREVSASVSGVTAMAYRSDEGAILSIAEPLLDWGIQAGKPVRIALESGPVAPEREERFSPAAEGRLAVLPTDRGATALLLEKEGRIAGARMFASRGTVATQPARISFLGNEARMLRTAQDLRPAFSAWASFEGISYHGLDWRRRETQRRGQPPPGPRVNHDREQRP